MRKTRYVAFQRLGCLHLLTCFWEELSLYVNCWAQSWGFTPSLVQLSSPNIDNKTGWKSPAGCKHLHKSVEISVRVCETVPQIMPAATVCLCASVSKCVHVMVLQQARTVVLHVCDGAEALETA